MKIFTEQQRFTQWWLYIILGVGLLVTVWRYFNNYAEMEIDKSAKFSFLISLFVILLVISLTVAFQLRTRIDEKGIHYQFFPIHRAYKIIEWKEVSKIYVRKYSPILEYGGWGFRRSFNRPKGRSYNVSGNQGIQLILTNGKKILIGTQNKTEAENIIKAYKTKILKSAG